MPAQTKLIFVLALAVSVVAGCNNQKKTGGLSVSTHSAATANASAAGLTLQNGIEITRIEMAVRKISVEGDDAEFACSTARSTTPLPMLPGTSQNSGPSSSGTGGSGVGEDHGHDGPEMGDDGECEFAFGPFDVDLAGSALTGKVSFAFDAPIPAGTYEEVKISVNTVPAGLAAGNPVLQDLADAHASILVDGFVQVDPSTSKPFTFSTPMEVKQKREGKIVIGQGSNVTLDFDPTHWFDGPNGRLDPTDPTAQGDILANIRASIRILKDDDHDGEDDDHEGHGH
jgi:hypothetical protein